MTLMSQYVGIVAKQFYQAFCAEIAAVTKKLCLCFFVFFVSGLLLKRFGLEIKREFDYV